MLIRLGSGPGRSSFFQHFRLNKVTLSRILLHRWRSKFRIFLVSYLCLFLLLTWATNMLSLSEDVSEALVSDTPNDRMLGLAFYPEIRAHPGENYRLWPMQVTKLDYQCKIIPSQPCRGDTYLVIFVHSRPHFTESRKAIRNTWGSVVRTRQWPQEEAGSRKLPNIELFFVTAESKAPGNENVTRALEAEAREHNDILMFDFVDNYFNLTIKSMMELRWFTEFCPHAQYVAKADDDVFIDVEGLVRMLQQGHFTQDTIIGDLLQRSEVQRSHPKWAVPHHRFNEPFYPDYMRGTTYVMTADLPKKMVDIAPYVLPIHVDDAYVTGILAKILNVNFVKVDSFRVLDKVSPHPCMLRYLQKVVTGGPTNPYLLKTSEKKEYHEFLYRMWASVPDPSLRRSCLLLSPYWALINLLL